MFKRKPLSGLIINAIIKSDPRCNDECQTDVKFARHSIFGSSPEPHGWRARTDLTETNERESPTLTLVCISPSSAICMKRNGTVVQRDWLTHKAVETNPGAGIWVTNTGVRRSLKTLPRKYKARLFILSR